jgi:MFS transporter, DHA2 family, methylenomycin A resistance protein
MGCMACVALAEVRHQALNDDLTSPVSGQSRLTLLAAVIGFFVVTLDAVVVNVALPSIHHAFEGGISGLQWVVDAYTLAFAGLLLAGLHRRGRVCLWPRRRPAGWPPGSDFSSLPGSCRAPRRRC